MRGRINALSKQVGTLRRDGKTEEAEVIQEESRLLGERESLLAAEYDDISTLLRDTLLGIPNLPAPEAPDGAGPEDNVVLETVGFDPDAYGDHQRVPHWEIGAELGILDPERAAKLSGSMFALYRGPGARLIRALTQLALDRHTSGAGRVRGDPPAQPRAHGDDDRDGPAAQVRRRRLQGRTRRPLADPHGRGAAHVDAPRRDPRRGDLPLRFTAYTPCFRREAGSAGADTRGTLRTHEFDKVELFAYCTPEQSSAVHDDMLGRALAIISDLGLAYRVLDLCTGDLGFSSAARSTSRCTRPGCDRWLEVSSVSWFSDYQARRANVRYRPDGARAPSCATR